MRTPNTRRESRQERGRYRRTTWLLAAAAALIIGAGVAGGTWWSQRDDTAMNVDPGEYVPPSDIVPPSSSPTSSFSSTSPISSSNSTSTPTPASQPAPDGLPTRVQVESGGRSVVDASLQATTLDADKVLAPPFGTAGWYAEPGWPKPGHAGASILVGHVNHGSNPDVFWNLPKVEVGDIVTVTYDSGEDVKFKITRSEPATKKDVPADDSIWDYDNPDPVLRLITCDPQTTLNEGHYEGNWVVWADQIVP